MSEVSFQNSVLESLALQMRDAPGVTAVLIRSGRRYTEYGTPVGPPRATWAMGTGVTIEVWGEDSTFVDALLELARIVDHRDHEIDDLAEALTQANDRQLRLFELSRLNVDSLDRTYTIDRVLRHGLQLTESVAAVFIGADGARMDCLEDESRSADWLADVAMESIAGGNLRRPIGARGKYVLLATVEVGERQHVIGIGRLDSVPFGTAERKILDALAGSLSSALRLVEMHESALAQAITENEHNTAAALANTVLPKSVASVPGINAFAACLPARSVGGDFFTTATFRGTLRFAIGDVAGKGLPAAVLMTNAITSANTAFRRSKSEDAVQLLAEIHDALETLLIGTNRFITMLVGVATTDPRKPGTVQLSLANAGHSPVILSVGGEIRLVPPCAPPVGVGNRPSGAPFLINLQYDDWLVTGSDGLLEQDGEDGELFGQERLEALVHGDISAAAMADRLLTAVREYGGDRPRSDDQTVFVLRPVGGPLRTEDLLEAAIQSAELEVEMHPKEHSVIEPSAIPASRSADVTDGRPRLTLDADLVAVRELATWLPESIRSIVGPETADSVVGPIELSIHELCINITEHAYADRVPTGSIDLSVTRQGDELVFEVFDAGEGFEPELIEEPDPAHPTVRGYGLMIIRQLASRVHYCRVDDFNQWTIHFPLPVAER